MSATTTVIQDPPVTAENVLQLFPDVNAQPITSSGTSSTRDADLMGYDAEQIALMEEVCIVLDDNDNPIGNASKKTCNSPAPRPSDPSLARFNDTDI